MSKTKNLFKPGQSGNPAGRPKGARNKLGERFLNELERDFREYGASAIAEVRETKPDVYLKVVAQIVPKQMQHTVSKGLESLLRDLNERRRISENTIEVEVIPDDDGTGSLWGEARPVPGRSLDASGDEARDVRGLLAGPVSIRSDQSD